MAVLKFHAARQLVTETIQNSRGFSPSALSPIKVFLLEGMGRVLCEKITADRDFPPFARSTRDGFAVRSVDIASIPSLLQIKGQVRAGQSFDGSIGPGECVEIMTGAPVPRGADAVVMVEYTELRGDTVEIQRGAAPGENIVAQGSEAGWGAALLEPGRRIGYAEIAMMAAVGKEHINVYPSPRVAILPTGDEVVELGVQPGPYQIRNSNSYSLQAQVAAAGGTPVPIGIAPDSEDRLREMIEEGLRSDLLLLSGGVSAGKYDLVEAVLSGLHAEFYFDAVEMQPGRPLVFGRVQKSGEQGTFFFGLPGNPLSTMVTFELFVRPALALLSGEQAAPFAPLRARLGRDLRRKPGQFAFFPALLRAGGDQPMVTPVEWKGSGDIVSLTRSNCYLVLPEDVSEIHAGDWVPVIPRD